MRREGLAHGAPLLGLCLVGAALRFATLGQQSFWLDEAATGRLVAMGLGGLFRGLPDGESTPPLYYVLAWLWTQPLGTGEVGLRSLSAVIGTLTIPLVYAAATRFFGHRAGLAAAALACFSPLLIWYSQEARAYTLLVALCAASLWALGAALEPGAGRGPLILWAVVGALALATHYFAVFVIAPEMVWLARARRRAAAPALVGVLLTGCALGPLALHQRAHGGAGFIASSPQATRLAQAAKQLAVGYDAPGQLLLTASAALVVVGLTWLLARRVHGSARRIALGLTGVAAASVLVPVVLAALGLDYVLTRNLIGTWVPAALALSAAGALTGGRAGPALVAGLCVIGLGATLGVDLDARYQRDDWRAAARTLPGPGATALVVTPGAGRAAFDYYLPGSRDLSSAGAAVVWIEVIGLGARGVGAPLRAPPFPAAVIHLGGFEPPVTEQHSTFSVLLYHAAGPPVLVKAPMLDQLALDRGSPATFLASH